MGAFTGKTVLILGGSRGIGAAIVRRFVTDGANVRFTYAGSKDAAEHLAQETGATAVFTDSADRDTDIDVVRKSGALDILVVNAGIGVFGDALELNADDIDRLFKINIHAPYHASVEAARQMPEGGRILIIGSVNGDRMYSEQLLEVLGIPLCRNWQSVNEALNTGNLIRAKMDELSRYFPAGVSYTIPYEQPVRRIRPDLLAGPDLHPFLSAG